ncbi:MAG: peptidoglycan editing factor PgeF [Treponema sp.]|jgi:YfiH family protein|nr:peptidoglycan editing factor PgeF [Treponema sp.]
MSSAIHYFDLDFNAELGNSSYASFPFYFNGNQIKEVTCILSGIKSGDMKYDTDNENRISFFKKLGIKERRVYGLKQIHSRKVLITDKNNLPVEEADGMVTRDSYVILSVTVADCLPVFLFDTKSGAFGIVHSGWKGTGIVIKALELMNEKCGTKDSDTAVIIGPCIDNCCYKVDKERYSLFAENFGDQSVKEQDGSYFIDLKKANIQLLEEAGVRNIAVCNNCTFTDTRLGSFRRQGENYTRMIAMIGKNFTQKHKEEKDRKGRSTG